jgi:beta-glucosidase
MGYYDPEQNFVIHPGEVEVMVGSSSEDIHCVGSFEITGQKTDISASKVFFSNDEITPNTQVSIA